MTRDSVSDDELDREVIWKEFSEAANMSPAELEGWLESEDSRSVGWTHEGETEAVGHESGRRIVKIKRKKKSDLNEDDYRHMCKVSDTCTATWRRAVPPKTKNTRAGAIH